MTSGNRAFVLGKGRAQRISVSENGVASVFEAGNGALGSLLVSSTAGVDDHNRNISEIGGMPDHVHILLALPSTLSIAKALQLIKAGSSKWVHDTFPEHRLFKWQVKYGAFSVSVSQLDKIVEYIRNQEAHHRKMTFQEEFLSLLKKHRVAYDERYLWE